MPGLPTRPDQGKHSSSRKGGSHLRCNPRNNAGSNPPAPGAAPTRCNPPSPRENGKTPLPIEVGGGVGAAGPLTQGTRPAMTPRPESRYATCCTTPWATSKATRRATRSATCWATGRNEGGAGPRARLPSTGTTPAPACTSPPMTYTDDRQEHGQEDVGGGTGHRAVDPSPGRAPRFPVTGRGHHVGLTRFLTPAGHSPAGKPPSEKGLPSGTGRHRTTIGTTTIPRAVTPPSPTNIGVAAFG
ncbi:hypothetical protein YUYDRAFT_07124 [Streptomyces sp. ScaeMP-e48]|nr:hypothetical protein YUYDRAFT_07124 [Streptomyces sp. ScaeMP-e48]